MKKNHNKGFRNIVFLGLVSCFADISSEMVYPIIEYSRAVTPQIRQAGNHLSGLAETAYASLLAQCFV